MNKILIIASLCIILVSCSNETNHSTENDTSTIHSKNEDLLAAKIDKAKLDSLTKAKISILNMRIDFNTIDGFFEHKNIKEINISSSLEEIDKRYTRLTSIEYHEAFQDSSMNYYDSEYDGAYYYSNQGIFNNIRRYIFIKREESCCINYYYNTYDNTGKKIQSTAIAGIGGDGGWTFDSYCSIINDSTINLTTIECEFGLDDDGKSSGDCDSTISQFDILKNGMLKKKTLENYKITK